MVVGCAGTFLFGGPKSVPVAAVGQSRGAIARQMTANACSGLQMPALAVLDRAAGTRYEMASQPMGARSLVFLFILSRLRTLQGFLIPTTSATSKGALSID